MSSADRKDQDVARSPVVARSGLAQLAPYETSDLFVELCVRLRAMGALRVDAFGLSAAFSSQQPERAEREPQRKPDPLANLSDEEREIMKRAGKLLGGAR